MTEFRKSIAVVLALCLSAPAVYAQDTTAPAAGTTAPATAPATPAPGATPAAPTADATPPAASAEGPGSAYIGQTFDDWQLRCFRAEDGTDPCEMYQIMHDTNGAAVADISMIPLPPGGKAVAGATLMAPLETLLTANLQLKVDDAQPKAYPFTFCAQPGCFARIGLLPEELAQLKKGTKVTVSLVPVSQPNRPVSVAISLKGFTAAYDAVVKNNATLKK